MPSCSEPEPISVDRCLAVERMAGFSGGMSPADGRRHRRVAQDFRNFLRGWPSACVDAATVHAWLCQRLQRISARWALQEVRRLRCVLEGLVPNPAAEWLARHPRPREALEVLKSAQPPPAPSAPGFVSILASDLEAFLAHKRRLGRSYQTQESRLRGFDRFVQARGIRRLEELDRRLLQDFAVSLRGKKPSSQSEVLFTVRYFFQYLRRTARLDTTPDSVLRPKVVRRPRQPYIFLVKELAAVLEAARGVRAWDGDTAFTVLHLIYACGLRIGEAVGLRLQDVDLTEAVLWIRHTKFGKSRRIPMGRRAAERMAAYLEARGQRFGTSCADDHCFITRRSKALTVNLLEVWFRGACRRAGVMPSGRPAPRVHDMRHSFAVHRLCKWYAEGCRPQDKLVLLSIYMGHVDVAYTAHYLQRTLDVLRLASARYGRQFDAILGELSLPHE